MGFADNAGATNWLRVRAQPLLRLMRWHDMTTTKTLHPMTGFNPSEPAILHDLASILEKFRKPRQKKATLSFLLFDHIGGIDTMLNTFGSGGTVVAWGRDE